MACTSKDLFQSIEHCIGTINVPGIFDEVLFVPESAIVTWPKIALPGTAGASAAADVNVYKQNFVLSAAMEAQTKFRSLKINRNKSSVSFESQGEEGCRTFLNKAEVTMYGTKEEILSFVTLANNEPIVFLCRRASDHRYLVLGSEMFGGAQVKSSGTVGSGPSEANETKLTIEATDFAALPFYNGEIETEAGKISGETGEPVEIA